MTNKPEHCTRCNNDTFALENIGTKYSRAKPPKEEIEARCALCGLRHRIYQEVEG